MPTTAKKPTAKQASRKAPAKRAPAAKNTPRKEKRTFRIEVLVKSPSGNVPEFKEGLGKGVLYAMDLTFNLTPQEYNSPLFAMNMLDKQNEAIREVIEGRITQVANP